MNGATYSQSFDYIWALLCEARFGESLIGRPFGRARAEELEARANESFVFGLL